jgi:hypothetical protein
LIGEGKQGPDGVDVELGFSAGEVAVALWHGCLVVDLAKGPEAQWWTWQTEVVECGETILYADCES